MKKIHIGLLPRIIIAIILGIAIGNFLPTPLVRLFVTFNSIFGEFLNFSIPLIILGLVTIAIADIGKGAGRMLLVTALIAYGATLFSGFLSYFTGAAIFPSLITPGAPLDEVSEAQGILPYFSVAIPPLMNVMTALVLAFTLGLGLASLHSDALKNVARDFQEIIVRMISAVILPLLPIYIFGIFLNMTHSGQVFSILMVFIKIIGVIFILHIFLLVFQYCIAALFVRKNPFRLLGRMLPAYFTALGTQSSVLTSEAIQKVWIEATKRRKRNWTAMPYLLIKPKETCNEEKTVCTQNVEQDAGSDAKNACNTEQSKVKQSREFPPSAPPRGKEEEVNATPVSMPGYAFNTMTHNYVGLMGNLERFGITDEKEIEAILRLSDYGRKGTPVWKLICSTNWSNIGAKGKYMIAALNRAKKRSGT